MYDIEKDHEKIKYRFRAVLDKYDKLEHLDDVAQEYFLTILEGKSQHQTLEQFFKDYSHKKRWYSRKNISDKARNKKMKFYFTRSIDQVKIPINYDIDSALDASYIVNIASKILCYRYFKIFTDYYVLGKTHQEISEELNITQSRITQLLKKIIHKLKYYSKQTSSGNIQRI